MTSIHDNPERGKMILRSVRECVALHEAPTIGNVADKLEKFPGFDLLDDELEEAIRELKLGPAEPPQQVAAPEPSLPVPVPEPTPAADDDFVEVSREQAQHLVETAHSRLDQARISVRVAQEGLRETKRKLGDAIMSWQQQVDPGSPAERQQRETRNFLASEQAKRAARGKPMSQASAFVQKNMQNGPRRGAFGRQYYGRSVKVPSQA